MLPERSKSWEHGINILRDGVLRDDDRLRTKIAYFSNDYTDYIVRTNVTGNPLGRYMFTNIPGAKTSGIETTVSYDARKVFAEFGLNYFDRFEYCFTVPSRQIDGCGANAYPGDWRGGYVPPKYTGNVTLGTRLLDERLVLGAKANFFGERAIGPPSTNGTDAPVMWAPSTIVDLFGSYKLSDNHSMSFSVENVFDRYYVSPMAVAMILSPGRTARATYTIALGEPTGDGPSPSAPQLTTPSSGYDWSGAFVGMQAGYALGDATAHGDASGTFRTGSNPNYVWVPYTATTSTDYSPAALTGGVFAGYNVQLNSLVLGVDGRFDYADPMFKDEQFVFSTTSATRTLTANVSSSLDWQAAIRGRVGLAFDRTLPYIAGGVAMASYSYDYVSFASAGSTTTRTIPDPMSLQGTYLGWSLGGGVEHAVTDNILLRADYSHNDFGKKTFKTPYGPHQVDLTTHQWSIGAAYKF